MIENTQNTTQASRVRVKLRVRVRVRVKVWLRRQDKGQGRTNQDKTQNTIKIDPRLPTLTQERTNRTEPQPKIRLRHNTLTQTPN
jgi:hypothetical protein